MVSSLIILILLILSSISKAVLDTLSFHFNGSIFTRFNRDWWDPAVSWENKYKSKLCCAKTMFVFLTDAWHLFQFLFLSCIQLAILTAVNMSMLLTWHFWVIGFIGLKILNGLVFELFYKKIFINGTS